jgi:DNA ligase-associated metallophosphoesterase
MAVLDRAVGEATVYHRARCGGVAFSLNGTSAVLRGSGALWLSASRTLVVSDLHLEKGSAYASKGQLLPPYDTRDTLDRLEAELEALSPRTLVLLGDSFHDARAVARIEADQAHRVLRLAAGRELVWIVGNHDVQDERSALGGLPGAIEEAVSIGSLSLRHEPTFGPADGEVSGHLHPCAKLIRAGRGVRKRCFLTDGARLVMPAFGAYAGGLNVLDQAYAGLFAGAPSAAALGPRRVHLLALADLSGD